MVMASIIRDKKGDVLNQTIVQIILIGIVFAIFITATAEKVNSRGIRQQVIERQTALLIDAGVPGMRFEIFKGNFDGRVDMVELKGGKVYIAVAGLASYQGYPYFTKYSVSVEETEDKFIVRIK